jgi:hypothetical protein
MLEELKRRSDEALKKYHEELNKQSTEELLSLEWTKDCDASLRIETLYGAGMPRFKLWLHGKIPLYKGTLTIVKSGIDYLHDIVYSSDYWNSFDGCNKSPCVFTYKESSLFDFLNSARFKSFSFPERDLELLNKLGEYKKSLGVN